MYEHGKKLRAQYADPTVFMHREGTDKFSAHRFPAGEDLNREIAEHLNKNIENGHPS